MPVMHFILVDEPAISTHGLPDGQHVVKTDQFGTKLIAHVENGRVTHYTAKDHAGKARPTTRLQLQPASSSLTVTPELKPVDCWECVGYDELSAGVCQQVDC